MNHLSEDYLFDKGTNSKVAIPVKIVVGRKKK